MRSYFTPTVKEGRKENVQNDNNFSENEQSSRQSAESSEQDESDHSNVLSESETPSLPHGAEVLETCDVGFP